MSEKVKFKEAKKEETIKFKPVTKPEEVAPKVIEIETTPEIRISGLPPIPPGGIRIILKGVKIHADKMIIKRTEEK